MVFEKRDGGFEPSEGLLGRDVLYPLFWVFGVLWVFLELLFSSPSQAVFLVTRTNPLSAS